MAAAPPPLPPEWSALGRRLAVGAGAGCALLALLNDAPASTAALRGAVAWLAVVLHFRLSARFLRWRLRHDAAAGARPAPAPGAGVDPTAGGRAGAAGRR